MIVSFLLCSSKHELARYVWKLFRRVPLQLDRVRSPTIIWKIQTNIPIGSMYGIYLHLAPDYGRCRHSKFTIHGSRGIGPLEYPPFIALKTQDITGKAQRKPKLQRFFRQGNWESVSDSGYLI